MRIFETQKIGIKINEEGEIFGLLEVNSAIDAIEYSCRCSS